MVPYFPDAIQTWDVNALNWIQEHICNPVLDAIFPVITLFGEKGLFLIAVAVIFLCFKRTRKTGIMMGAALLLGLIIGNGILKNLFARIRPCDINTQVQLLIARPNDFSFPSGHTAASFTASAALYFSGEKKLWKPALIIACLLAFSRLYLYVHYPTDILGGILIGILAGYIGYAVVNRWMGQKKNK